VLEVDGHDLHQLLLAYDLALAHTRGPTIIIARTVKGHGLSLSENKVAWHNRVFTQQEAQAALAELGEVA
jgi:transketolase